MTEAERQTRVAAAREATRDARAEVEAGRVDGPTGVEVTVPWAELLDRSGLPDAEIARRAEVSPAYISLLRAGRRGRTPEAQRRVREVVAA